MGLRTLKQLQNFNELFQLGGLGVVRWYVVVEIPLVIVKVLLLVVVTSSSDQFPPDGPLLENLPGQLVSLSKIEGGLKVEVGQELLDQLRRSQEHLGGFALSQRHVLYCDSFLPETELESHSTRG